MRQRSAERGRERERERERKSERERERERREREKERNRTKVFGYVTGKCREKCGSEKGRGAVCRLHSQVRVFNLRTEIEGRTK